MTMFIWTKNATNGVIALVNDGDKPALQSCFEIARDGVLYEVVVGRAGRNGPTPFGEVDSRTPLQAKVVRATPKARMPPGMRKAISAKVAEAKHNVRKFDAHELRAIICHAADEATVLTFDGKTVGRQTIMAEKVDASYKLADLRKGSVADLALDVQYILSVYAVDEKDCVFTSAIDAYNGVDAQVQKADEPQSAEDLAYAAREAEVSALREKHAALAREERRKQMEELLSQPLPSLAEELGGPVVDLQEANGVEYV